MCFCQNAWNTNLGIKNHKIKPCLYIAHFQGFVILGRKKLQKSVKKSAEKFGGKEKSRTFATRLRKNGKFIDKFEKR